MSYIGNEPVVSATRTITEVVASAGQTTFYPNGGYTVGYLDVVVNGSTLQASDFVATNGTSVTLNVACVSGDDVKLIAWGTFTTSTSYTKTEVDAFAVKLTGNQTVAGVKTFSSAPVLPSASIPQAALAANVAGNGPAFSAYLGTSQNISAGTWTKVQINTKEFDTASSYDNTTNYRFQPTVAGYYQVNVQLLLNNSSANYGGVGINKTGSQYKYVYISNAYGTSAATSALIYLNGSTDYLEMYGFVSAAANVIYNGSLWTSFQASLVRAA